MIKPIISTSIWSNISNNKKYIQTTYNKESRSIKHGGNHSVYIKPSLKDINNFPFLKNEYAPSISRIEPENNCRLILDTFSKSSDIQLIYIGNWDNSKYSKALKLLMKNIIREILLINIIIFYK